jgi:SAM-dependent methyltransferase
VAGSAGLNLLVQALTQAFPRARVEGIEPVAELREQDLRIHGIDASWLREGDALHLPFVNDSFDKVVETGVMHHIRDWRRAVAEMARGVGSAKAPKLKTIIKNLGC